jgi:dipeptidyl aminopeptidase/acylaminoacyl peptidase
MLNYRALILLGLASLHSFAHGELLPVEAFGNLPQTKQLKLSPNGKSLAFIREHQGQTLIGVADLVNGGSNYIVRTDNQKFKIGWFRWANDQTLLISSDYPVSRRGVKYTETRLMKIGIEAGAEIEPVVVTKKNEHISQFQDNIIDILPNEPNHFLMALDLKSPNYPSVYKIDLNSKRIRKLIYSSKSNIRDWLTDRQHRVRLGIGRDETSIFFRLYDLQTEEWRNIWHYEIFDAPDISPLGFGLNPNELYIRADHNGRYAIFKVHLLDPKLSRELVFSDPDYDVEGSLIYSRKTNDVIGVYHGEADDSKVYFDKSYASFQKALNKAIPDSYNNISSFSSDENKYILFSSNWQTPGAYYIGDRTKGTLDFVSEQYPLLREVELSTKQKIVYKAKDGTEIEAYVTLPMKNVKDLNAAIVIPHGGPMARNYSGFDWFSQFFASRGYTIIEPNFRGSSGYGFEFEMASIKNWGGVMQDDLADAAMWLVDQQKIDKNKICIVGASYGGYAAMMAAVKQQDVFKCAASFAGVSDLELLLVKARKFTNYKVVKKQIGSDSDFLEKASPINYVKKINTPLLLIHGENDRVVDVTHSRNMFDELEDEGKLVEYVELTDGNHYLEIEKNRLLTLSKIEAFLQRYLH